MKTGFEFKIILSISVVFIFNACKLVQNDNNSNAGKLYFIKDSSSGQNHSDNKMPDSNYIKKYDSIYLSMKSSQFKRLRQPVWRPTVTELDLVQDMQINMMACFDRSGITKFVKALPENSSQISKNSLVKAVKYLSQFTWEESFDGPEEVCRGYKIIVDNKRN